MTKELEEAFEKLKNNGQATVEKIVKWMKDAKVLEKAQKTEEEATAMFSDVQDKSAVTKDKFMEVIQKMAASAKISPDAICQQMVQAGGQVMNAVAAAGTALSSLAGTAADSFKK